MLKWFFGNGRDKIGVMVTFIDDRLVKKSFALYLIVQRHWIVAVLFQRLQRTLLQLYMIMCSLALVFSSFSSIMVFITIQ